jgi:hypothetical protein
MSPICNQIVNRLSHAARTLLRMKIGVARHYKIPYRKWRWINSTGYADFLRWYDGSEGRPQPRHPSAAMWQQCFSSDLLRAVETAARLTAVPATFMPMLREIPQAPPFDTRLKLPLVVWHVLSRIAWWCNHPSQPEGRREAVRRAARIVDFLRRQPADQPVLIVTHGFLMYVLRRELKRSGFAGWIPTHPKCGEVYMYQGPTALPLPDARRVPESLTVSASGTR